MKVKPLGNHVLVRPEPAQDKSKGGILIPDNSKEKPLIGEILAVGPGETGSDGKLLAMSVKKGDKVLYTRYAGSEIKDLGEDLIMRESDILAVVE